MKMTGLLSMVLAVAAACLLSAAAPNPDEAAAWEPIKVSGSADQLKAFLDAYPNGTFAREARQKYSVIANAMLAPVMQKIKVGFPSDARRLGRSVGPIRVVKLDILVQQDGKAANVDVADSSGFIPYDNAALAAVRGATFLPAINHGMPVESRMAYEVSFGLLCNRATGNLNCDYGKYPTSCSATVCALLLR
jgi:TonB family protein